MVFFLIMYNDGVFFFSKDLVYVWRNMFFVVFKIKNKIFCVKFGLHLNHSRTENHLSLASLVTRSLGPHQEKVRGRKNYSEITFTPRVSHHVNAISTQPDY